MQFILMVITHIFSLPINQDVSLRMIQITKGNTERKIFKKYYAIKKQLVVTCGVMEVTLELW
jgi:hypothetical protein